MVGVREWTGVGSWRETREVEGESRALNERMTTPRRQSQ